LPGACATSAARGCATYDRGTFGLALALAFTPVVATEAAAVHLLLRGGIAAWILTALHAYALLWLWGFFLGPRAYPHRVGPRTAQEPLITHRLAVASDDPDTLVERLLAASPARAPRSAGGIGGGLRLLAGLDLAGLGRDALQPG
jgi:hypothetical protein